MAPPVEDDEDRLAFLDADEWGVEVTIRAVQDPIQGEPVPEIGALGATGRLRVWPIDIGTVGDPADFELLEPGAPPTRIVTGTTVLGQPELWRLVNEATGFDFGTLDPATGEWVQTAAWPGPLTDPVTATYRFAPQTVRGIWDREHQIAELADGVPVSTREPQLLVREADVLFVPHEDDLDLVFSHDGADWRIDDVELDGTGMAVLRVHRGSWPPAP